MFNRAEGLLLTDLFRLPLWRCLGSTVPKGPKACSFSQKESNLLAMASNLRAMTSYLLVMA